MEEKEPTEDDLLTIITDVLRANSGCCLDTEAELLQVALALYSKLRTGRSD